MNEKVNPGKLLKSFNGTFGTTADPMFAPTSLFPHGGCLQIVAYSKIMAQLSQGWMQRGEGASGFISGSNCCCCCFWHDAICCSSEEHRGPRYSLHPLPFLADSLVPRSPEPVMDRATCNELPNTQIRASGVWLLPSPCHCCSAYWGILIYIRGYDSLLRSSFDVYVYFCCCRNKETHDSFPAYQIRQANWMMSDEEGTAKTTAVLHKLVTELFIYLVENVANHWESLSLPNAKKEKKKLSHFLAPYRHVAVSAATNWVTKEYGRHLSVCYPFVVSLTPTTNQFPPSLHPPSVDVFHKAKHISSLLTHLWQITNRSNVRGFAGPRRRESQIQCIWKWRADDCQAVVINMRYTQLTMELWEPPLTIWWHLAEPFVRITLFNLIYASLRKKYVYVYFFNGIWICATDKYLQSRWRAIYQVYDGFLGWGRLHQNG